MSERFPAVIEVNPGAFISGSRTRRRWLIVPVVCVCLKAGGVLFSPDVASAQVAMMEPSAELDRLDFLVGHWDVTVEATIGGKTLTFSGTALTSWHPRRTWLATTSSVRLPGESKPMQAREFVAWNAEAGRYEWTGIDDQSTIVHSGTAAWNESGDWVMEGHPFEWPDGKTYRLRRTISRLADGSVRDVSEMSIDGDEYNVNGTMVKRRRMGGGTERSAEKARPEPVESTLEGPLGVLDFYVGRIVPTEAADQQDWSSEVLLTPGVGGKSLRFLGRWDRPGFPPEFVNGNMAWDPVAEAIRISAIFFHGAYFDGEVVILDAEKRVLQRDWTGKYSDGRVIRYRETWTPVSEDEFEWKIEHLVDGEWRFDLPPGVMRAPIHRVERP